MTDWIHRVVGRRRVIAGLVAVPVGLIIAACSDDDTPDGGTVTPTEPVPSPTPSTATATPVGSPTTTPTAVAALEPTPACGDDDDHATVAQTEGPFFTPDSPQRSNLREPGLAGAALVVSGFVLSTTCRPIAGALVDLWQCDDDGAYDNEGYVLRGHQFTDDAGRWQVETIVPGLYAGRTRHIHVKVQAPGEPVLTTQLYFPGDPGNASDGIYDERLLLHHYGAAPTGGMAGTFDFVLEVA